MCTRCWRFWTRIGCAFVLRQPTAALSAYSLGRLSFSTFRVGNVEFFLLDTRSMRDLQDTKNPNKAGTSILGRRQREWLMNAMKASDADFFFLASSVNVTVPHLGGPGGQRSREQRRCLDGVP